MSLLSCFFLFLLSLLLSLTLAEREEISRGLVAGNSIRSIAASLGRAPSTVSREVNRNGGRRRYRANKADQAAWCSFYSFLIEAPAWVPVLPWVPAPI